MGGIPNNGGVSQSTQGMIDKSQISSHGNDKNMRIMLVGNNGGHSKGVNHYKANFVDSQNGYVTGASLPKTTKNNITKFYTHGGNNIEGGFLNAINTPQNKQNNSFRQEGIIGVGSGNLSQNQKQGSMNAPSLNLR